VPATGDEGLGAWLHQNSRFYVWQKTALRDVKGHLRAWLGRAEPAHWVFAREEPADVAEAWRLTGRLLEAFRSDVEAGGARFVVALIPSAEQVYDDLWERLRRQAGEAGRHFDRTHPEERLGGLCRQAGIPLITMTAAFRARASSASSTVEHEWLFHQGRWHLNDEGQRIAAEEIHRALAPLL
jgi:hypothetical protein